MAKPMTESKYSKAVQHTLRGDRMTKVTETMVERAWSAMQKAGVFRNNHDMIRKALEAALDNRVGEADRRKLRDDEKCIRLGARRRSKGRRSTDITDWMDLPLATPPQPEIGVSEGMIAAAHTVSSIRLSGQIEDCDKFNGGNILAQIYTAMESKRREEEGVKVYSHQRGMDPLLAAQIGHTAKPHPHRRSTDGIGGTDGA